MSLTSFHDPQNLVEALRKEVAASVSDTYTVRELNTLSDELEKINRSSQRHPKWLRPLFRNQGRYNALLVEVVRLLTRNFEAHNARQQRELAELRVKIERLQNNS